MESHNWLLQSLGWLLSKFCYAERIFPRVYGKERKFTDVRTHPERLDEPLHWKKPRKIFVNSMGDLFHEAVPIRFIAEVFNTMATYRLICRKRDCDHNEPDCYEAPGHIFQILTKQPRRMLELLKPGGLLERDIAEFWPGDSPISDAYENEYPFQNVWLGVSVEDQATADERIPLLLQTPAAVRFVSAEPLLGPVDLHLNCPIHFYPGEPPSYDREADLLHLVIAGGESGPNARPADLDWFRSVRDQCQAAGVKFFMKQITEHGKRIPFNQWPKDLRIREYPNASL